MAVAAYLYCGDWVADCSRPGCSSTEHLYALRSPGKPPGPMNPRSEKASMFRCSNCLHLDWIDWPDPEFMAAAAAVVALRPVPQNRNWYPKDHPVAVAFHLAHCQTLADLVAENDAHGVPA